MSTTIQHQMSSSLFASQVWSVALKQDSTLLTPATLAKLPAEEAASVSELCSLLLLQHAHYLDPPTAATVARLMLAVLLHYAAPVRRAGVKAVAHCVAEKPQLAGVNATMSCLPSLAAWFKCIECIRLLCSACVAQVPAASGDHLHNRKNEECYHMLGA